MCYLTLRWWLCVSYLIYSPFFNITILCLSISMKKQWKQGFTYENIVWRILLNNQDFGRCFSLWLALPLVSSLIYRPYTVAYFMACNCFDSSLPSWEYLHCEVGSWDNSLSWLLYCSCYETRSTIGMFTFVVKCIFFKIKWFFTVDCIKIISAFFYLGNQLFGVYFGIKKDYLYKHLWHSYFLYIY